MIDATDLKAHPTASSLNKRGAPRLVGRTKGGMTSSKLHGVCDSKGRCRKKLVHYSKRLSQASQNRDALFPTEGLAAHYNPL